MNGNYFVKTNRDRNHGEHPRCPCDICSYSSTVQHNISNNSFNSFPWQKKISNTKPSVAFVPYYKEFNFQQDYFYIFLIFSTSLHCLYWSNYILFHTFCSIQLILKLPFFYCVLYFIVSVNCCCPFILIFYPEFVLFRILFFYILFLMFSFCFLDKLLTFCHKNMESSQLYGHSSRKRNICWNYSNLPHRNSLLKDYWQDILNFTKNKKPTFIDKSYGIRIDKRNIIKIKR